MDALLDKLIMTCGISIAVFGFGGFILIMLARRFAPTMQDFTKQSAPPAQQPLHVSYDTHYHTVQREWKVAPGVDPNDVAAEFRVNGWMRQDPPQVRIVGGPPEPGEYGFGMSLEMPADAWPGQPGKPAPETPQAPVLAVDPHFPAGLAGSEPGQSINHPPNPAFNPPEQFSRVAWNRADDSQEMIDDIRNGMTQQQARAKWGIGAGRWARIRQEIINDYSAT